MSKNGPSFDDKVSETLFCNISFRDRELIKCERHSVVMQLQIKACHQSQVAINHRYFWAFFQFLHLMLQFSSSTPGALRCLFSCWGALLKTLDHSDSESEGLCVCIMPRTAHATDSWQADVLESFKMRFHNFLLSKSFSQFPVSSIMPSIYLHG